MHPRSIQRTYRLAMASREVSLAVGSTSGRGRSTTAPYCRAAIRCASLHRAAGGFVKLMRMVFSSFAQIDSPQRGPG